MSDSSWTHRLQHTRFPCLSPTPGVYSNSCPSSQWCHPAISFCHPLLFLPSVFPIIRVFSNESALRIKWPKYWRLSFSISPSNEYSGLMDGLLWPAWSPRDSQESSPAPQLESITSLVLSLLYGPRFTSVHDSWKKNSFDYMDLYQQSDMSTF